FPTFVDLKDLPIFPDALTYVCISLVKNVESDYVRYIDLYNLFLKANPEQIPAALQNAEPYEVPTSYLEHEEGWFFPSPLERQILYKLQQNSNLLSEIGEARTGLFSGLDDVLMIYPEDEAQLRLESDILLP